MTGIPQVAEAMQTVLSTNADEAGRRTVVIQRQTKLTGGAFT